MNPFQVKSQQDGMPKKKVFCCRVCNKSLPSKSLRTQHELETHPKKPRPFSCPTCKKGFFLKAHVLSHVKVHSKDKLLKCYQCCFSTKWKSSLNRHRALGTHHVNKWQARRKGNAGTAFNCEKCENRRSLRIPNHNLIILNVPGPDGKMRRMRFQPPTKESREWLRNRQLEALQRAKDLVSVEDFQLDDFEEQFN